MIQNLKNLLKILLLIRVTVSQNGTCPNDTPYTYVRGCSNGTYYLTQQQWEDDFCANNTLTLKSNEFLQRDNLFCGRTSSSGEYNLLDPTVSSTKLLSYCDKIGNLPSGDNLKSVCKNAQNQIIDCTAQECRRKYCFGELLDSYQKQYVCALDKLYNSQAAFCEAYSLEQTFLYILSCGNIQTCTSKRCCSLFCQQLNRGDDPARPFCQATTFKYISTEAQYCDTACNGGSYVKLVADQTIIAENGNTVEQNCCLVKYPHSVCYADLTLKSNTTLCNDLIPDYTLVEGVDFLTCTGGCTQNDCAMFQCLADQTKDQFCDVNGVYYTTKQDYCTAKIAYDNAGQPQGPNFDLGFCYDNNGSAKDQLCTSTQNCNHTICLDNEVFDDVDELCDVVNYDFYTNLQQYCKSRYLDDQNTAGVCPGCNGTNSEVCCATQAELNGQGQNDTPFETCCTRKCELVGGDDFYCNDQFQRISQSNKCKAECDASPTIYTCNAQQGGCTQSDCELFQCEFGTLSSYTSNVVCGQIGTTVSYYDTKRAFCEAQAAQNALTPVTREGKTQLSEDDCKYLNCLQVNAGYQANSRCRETDFFFYADLEAICTLTEEGEGAEVIATGDGGQLNEDQCKVEKCKLDTTDFIPQCHITNGNYVLLTTEDEYCTEKEVNGQTVFKKCRNEANDTDVSCSKCSYSKCIDTNIIITSDICVESEEIKENLNSFYFSTIHQYCYSTEQYEIAFDAGVAEQNKIDTNQTSYVLTNQMVNTCDGTCDNENECCLARCNNDVGFVKFCSTDYDSITQSAFCTDQCGAQGIVDQNVTCDGDCENTDCYKAKCNADLQNNTNNICLFTDFSTVEEFYSFSQANKHQDYCDSLTYDTKLADYSVVFDNDKECLINETLSNCPSRTACCLQRCKTNNNRNDTCDSNNQLLTLDLYCDLVCAVFDDDDSLIAEKTCGGNCTQQDCDNFQCLEDVADLFDGVSNDFNKTKFCQKIYPFLFYETHQDYCDYYFQQQLNTVSEMMFCGEQQPCTQEDACCIANCKENKTGNFTPICEDTVFIYYANTQQGITEFCERECEEKLDGDGETEVSIFLQGNDIVNQCCVERCKLTNSDQKAVCTKFIEGDDENSFKKLELNELCTEACPTSDDINANLYTFCDNGCSDRDCSIERCKYETDLLTNQTVCDAEGVFHSTIESYCIKKVDEGVDFVTCSENTHCTSQKTCDRKICELQETYTKTCKTDFTILDTLVDYCGIVHGDTTDGDDILKCGQDDHECTEDECKVQECLSEQYFIGCSPIEILQNQEVLSSTLTKQQYCDRAPLDEQFKNGVDFCGANTDCTQTDCDVINCNHQLTTYTQVCYYDDQQYQYVTRQNFCNTKNGDISSKEDCSVNDPPTTDGDKQICIDEQDCCVNHCLTTTKYQSLEDEDIVCDQDVIDYFQKDQYCENICNGELQPLMCDDRMCKNNECRVAKCLFDGPFRVCDNVNNFFAFLTTEEYCQKFVANNEYSFNSCGERDCEELDCKQFLCKENNKEYSSSTICLKDPLQQDQEDFFGSMDDYCLQAATNDQTDAITNNLFCPQVCDILTCCIEQCLDDNQGLQTVCKSDLSGLYTNREQCQFFCENNTFPTQRDCDGDCTQNDCDYYQCLDSTTTLGDDKVCINTDQLNVQYILKETYCNEKHLQSLNITIKECEQNVDCNEENCCIANCLDNDFQGGCFTTDFIFITTHNTFCNKLCTEGLTIHTVDGNYGNIDQCEEQQCLKGDEYAFMYCSKVDYTLLDEAMICKDLSLDQLEEIEGCFEKVDEQCQVDCALIQKDCTQTDCDIKKCVLDMANYQNAKVCADNYLLYNSIEEYCNAKEADQSTITTFISCANDACNNSDDCCEQNCILAEQENFSQTCQNGDGDFQSIQTVQEYCRQKCLVDFTTWTSCLNDQQQRCTQNYCCNKRCNLQEYIKVCSSENDFSLLSQSDYCSSFCLDQTTYFSCPLDCEGDCQKEDCPDNCQFLNCQRIVDIKVTTVTEVCDKEGVYHADSSAFCTVNENNYDLVQLCSDGQDNIDCPSETVCCEQACMSKFKDDFTSGCDSNDNLHSSLTDFCTEYCVQGQQITIKKCDDVNCTLKQCCSLNCEKEEYTSKCSTDFALQSESDYCTSSCSDQGVFSAVTQINCFDINNQEKLCETQRDCDVEKCVDNTNRPDDHKFCYADKVGEKIYYISRRFACTEVETNLHNQLDDGLMCADEGSCDTEHDCCYDQCIVREQYEDQCYPDDNYDLLVQTEYCRLICPTQNLGVNLPIEDPQTEKCENGCLETDCTQMRCLSAYGQTETDNICTVQEVGAIGYFYTYTQLCTHKVQDQDTDYTFDSLTVVTCKDEQNQDLPQCPDSDQCCYYKCFTENEPYLVSCVQDALEETKEDYCTALCGQQDTKQCFDFNTNEQIACQSCFQSCDSIFESQQYTFATLCFNNQYFDQYFFGTQFEFCQKLEENNVSDFSMIPNALLCNNQQCNNEDECSERRCLEEDYIDKCLNNTYTILTQQQYCQKTHIDKEQIDFSTCDGDCDASTCCKRNLTQFTDNDKICTNKGLNKSKDEFCTQLNNQQQVSVVECSQDSLTCNDYECCRLHCMDLNLTFPICGTNFIHYSNQVDFCEEKCINNFEHKENEVLDCETDAECKVDCCLQQCGDHLEPVIQVANGEYVVYQNLCVAKCNNPTSTVVGECASDTAKADCLQNFLDNFCQECENLSTTNKYCSEGDQSFLSEKEKCILYDCQEGLKFGQTIELTQNCQNNDCSQEQCEKDLCVFDCSLGQYSKVCTVRNLLSDTCLIDCYGYTLKKSCAEFGFENDETACFKECAKETCEETQENNTPVCANDGNVYDDRCAALQIQEVTATRNCIRNCEGDFRLNFCKFECQLDFGA